MEANKKELQESIKVMDKFIASVPSPGEPEVTLKTQLDGFAAKVRELGGHPETNKKLLADTFDEWTRAIEAQRGSITPANEMYAFESSRDLLKLTLEMYT